MACFGIFAIVLVFVAQTPASASHVYLSFYGYQSAPAGCYSETDSVLTLDETATIGPEFQGSIYYFGLLSRNNSSVGCGYPDTDSDPGCAGYDVTAWFEPGDVPIGHVDGSGDQNAQLVGNEWLGHIPTDFTHMRIQFQAGAPCEQDTRDLMVPIVWQSQPVPAHLSTWGHIKALYR